ncbi:hypothetical protein FN846DRAFT_910902 [Sphaerosporella brunnea]|uniref:Uncharacterized protein n=1 Tax=Sphaerosporella brunnea TaxID=1250544 RepID=A0A5J5EKQ5_9PEZI|nr:hypothetical protein FN846DRAFT_910902 [Sphaerosporella brunnea]
MKPYLTGQQSYCVYMGMDDLDIFRHFRIVMTAYLQDPTIPPDVEEWNRFLRSAVPQNLRDMDIKIRSRPTVS